MSACTAAVPINTTIKIRLLIIPLNGFFSVIIINKKHERTKNNENDKRYHLLIFEN